MTTTILYEILDKVLPSHIVYNLQKVRNLPYWRLRVWHSETFDKLGILAPYIEDELDPVYYDHSDIIAEFLQDCNVCLQQCKK